MQQKHILFLCGWYPSRVLPNNGDFIQRHAEAVRIKHHVSVLHIISDYNCKQNIEFTREIINGVHTYITYVKTTTNPIKKAYRFFKAFKQTVKHIGKFDVVHLNKLFPFGLFALYFKWLYKKVFIISEHWTGYHKPQSQNISGIEIFISKIIAKHAKHICPVSKNLQNAMEDIGITGTYHIVPNVVDTSLFKPTIKQNKQFTILHVSNMLDAHKNVSGIIESIKKFSEFTTDFKLILVGENAIQYQKKAKALNISKYIDFIDHLPHVKIVELMQQADIFVLFSNYENLPCVILESFACGTPVISTNVGGISEFFPDDFGFLIDAKNQAQLLNKLKLTYVNKNFDKDKLHKYATQNFGKTAIAESFSKLYCN